MLLILSKGVKNAEQWLGKRVVSQIVLNTYAAPHKVGIGAGRPSFVPAGETRGCLANR